MAEQGNASHVSAIFLRFPYRLSDLGDERWIASHGSEPPKRPFVRVSLPELSPDLRARAAVLRKHLPAEPAGEVEYPLLFTSIPVLDEATSDAAVIIAAWETHLRKQRQEEEAKAAAQRQREAQAAEESRLFKAWMSSWITDYGSEALRTAHLRGYNVVGQYVRERTAKEFPGFEIDTQKKAKWEDRANPSAAALALETEALTCAAYGLPRPQVRIIWLTRSIDGVNYKPLVRLGGSGPQPREAVVVVGFLGRYTLVRDVAPEAPR